MVGMARGGRREGSGQLPGHRFEKRQRSHSEAVLEAFADATASPTVRKDATVTVASDDRQLLTVAAFTAQGLTWSEIARRTGRDRETCKRWQAAYPEVFDSAVREYVSIGNPRLALAHLTAPSILAVGDALDPDLAKIETRLAAAVHVQAYEWDRPKSRADFDAQVSVHISFASFTPEPEHRSSTIVDLIDAQKEVVE